MFLGFRESVKANVALQRVEGTLETLSSEPLVIIFIESKRRKFTGLWL
jgi:hypothetical protein